MYTASPILSEYQSSNLGSTAYQSINGVDLNYEGHSNVDGNDFVLEGNDAIHNKVLFWLTSVSGDYVREPQKGGPLYAILGKSLKDEDLENIKTSLTDYFNENFQGELSLEDVQIQANKSTRGIVLVLYVHDPLRRELFKVSAAVEL